MHKDIKNEGKGKIFTTFAHYVIKKLFYRHHNHAEYIAAWHPDACFTY